MVLLNCTKSVMQLIPFLDWMFLLFFLPFHMYAIVCVSIGPVFLKMMLMKSWKILVRIDICQCNHSVLCQYSSKCCSQICEDYTHSLEFKTGMVQFSVLGQYFSKMHSNNLILSLEKNRHGQIQSPSFGPVLVKMPGQVNVAHRMLKIKSSEWTILKRSDMV